MTAAPLNGSGASFRAAASGADQGAFFNMARRKFQNFSTESIWIFSSGECTPSSVGPKETISIPGIRSPMIPHSSPAWIAFTSGSLPKSDLYVCFASFRIGDWRLGFHPG